MKSHLISDCQAWFFVAKEWNHKSDQQKKLLPHIFLFFLPQLCPKMFQKLYIHLLFDLLHGSSLAVLLPLFIFQFIETFFAIHFLILSNFHSVCKIQTFPYISFFSRMWGFSKKTSALYSLFRNWIYLILSLVVFFSAFF